MRRWTAEHLKSPMWHG